MRSLFELRYIDKFGELQITEIRTTKSSDVVRAETQEVKAMIQGYLDQTGAEFVSMQLIEQVPRSA